MVCRETPRVLAISTWVMFCPLRSSAWHQNVHCSWSGGTLLLVADNDFDPDGKALADELSDALAACTPTTLGYRIRIDSVVKLP